MSLNFQLCQWKAPTAYMLMHLLITFLSMNSSAFASQDLKQTIQNTHNTSSKHHQQDVGTTAFGQAIQQWINLALETDLWQQANQHKYQAAHADIQQARFWDDPLLSIDIKQLPTDTLSFRQEAMTQVSLGATQWLPRGEHVALQQQRIKQSQAKLTYDANVRRIAVSVEILKTLSLIALFAEKQNKIQQAHEYFSQQVLVSLAKYRSTTPASTQSDVLNAELILHAWKARETQAQSEYQRYLAQLATWLPPEVLVQVEAQMNALFAESTLDAVKQVDFPDFSEPWRHVLAPTQQADLAMRLQAHPFVQALSAKVAMQRTKVREAENTGKPKWGVRASFSQRQDDALGTERADFVSVGVLLSAPVFQGEKVTHAVNAAIAHAEANETERRLLLQQWSGQILALSAAYRQQKQRLVHFQRTLLPQAQANIDTRLSAYQHDVQQFNQVMNAYELALNINLQYLSLVSQQYQLLITLMYYLPSNAFSVEPPASNASLVAQKTFSPQLILQLMAQVAPYSMQEVLQGGNS